MANMLIALSMLNQLAEQIKALNLTYFDQIEVSDNKLIVSTSSSATMPSYELTGEVLKMHRIVEDGSCSFKYDDDNHILTFTVK